LVVKVDDGEHSNGNRTGEAFIVREKEVKTPSSILLSLMECESICTFVVEMFDDD
jgi:hypothetical protein